MMTSTFNGFGFNTLTPSFINGLGGFVPGLSNLGGFNSQIPVGFGWNTQFNGLGFNGQSPIGLGWNSPMNGLSNWNTLGAPATPFSTINPSFVGGWNGLSPLGFNPMNIPSLFNTPSINSWNGFTGQSPIGLGWNGQINPMSTLTPSFGGYMPFVSPINTFPGLNTGFFPGYSTPSFNQGFVNTINPTVNGGTVPGYTNSPINTGNLYGQNSNIPSNGFNTPYANTIPYSPFGVHTSATCAHAA